MVALAATPVPPSLPTSIKLGRCLGVEVFAAGRYRGRTWTIADLDEIVRNFWKLGPLGLKLLDPPLVVGHEESQDFLERTNLPSAGWLRTLRRVGDILIGDVIGVPEAIANLINARLYKKVSAEIYDDFPDDFGNTHGLAIRRLALLGGEIPQVKRLEDVPLVTFAEFRLKRYAFRRVSTQYSPSRGTWISFSEVTPMNRDQAIAALKACMPNLSQATIDTMIDDQLIDLANNLPKASATPAPAPTPVVSMTDLSRDQMITELVALGQDPAVLGPMGDNQIEELYESLLGIPTPTPTPTPTPVVTMADPAPQSREQMIAALVAAGQDAASLQSKTDQELADMLKPVNPAPTPNPEPSSTAMADAVKKVTLMSEASIKAMQAANRRRLEEQKALDLQATARKKMICEMFAEKLVTEGRLTSAFKPAVIADLMAADDMKITRFSDKGVTVETTNFARKMAEYEMAPVIIHFGEKLKGSGTGSAPDDLKAVTAFAEANAAALKLSGKTPAGFIQKFSELKQKQPSLTAREYGIPENYLV